MLYYEKNIKNHLEEILPKNIASIIFDYYYVEYVECEFNETILIPLENYYKYFYSASYSYAE